MVVISKITVTNNTGSSQDIALIVYQLPPNNVKIFNATTDWSGPSGGFYTVTLAWADHGKSKSPIAQVFQKDGTDYYGVDVDRVTVNSSGDVTIRVPDSPDSRFEGKLVVS